jgi:hypothetical protein
MQQLVITTDDGNVAYSDAYTVTPESTVVLAAPQQPFIKLDDKHYKLVDKMEALVEGYPSLLGCTSLKVCSLPHLLPHVEHYTTPHRTVLCDCPNIQE